MTTDFEELAKSRVGPFPLMDRWYLKDQWWNPSGSGWSGGHGGYGNKKGQPK